MTRKQLFLGILFLLAFDFGMDGYLDRMQELENHNNYQLTTNQRSLQ